MNKIKINWIHVFNDGVCLHPIYVFFGGMVEASMKEDEQGAHVEF